MLARLTVVSGAKSQHIHLHLPTVIGRGSGAKLKLPSSIVSRQHCEIYEYDGQIAVRDLGSSNGTIVNGHRISSPTFVLPDDDVAIGPVLFHLQQTAAATPPENPSVGEAHSVPDFDELPTATTPPSLAEEICEPTEYEREVPQAVSRGETEARDVTDPQLSGSASERTDASESEAAEGSVLRYSAPERDGERSFVEIETDQQRAPLEDAAPALQKEGSSPDVETDDSSLQNFLNQLET